MLFNGYFWKAVTVKNAKTEMESFFSFGAF